MRLLLASGYTIAIRVRRLVTGEAAAATAFALLGLLAVLRGSVLGVRELDAASAGLADHAVGLRFAIATALFAGVIGIAGALGMRLGLGLRVTDYLHLPVKFESVYRCHLLWSLLGWWLVIVPLFVWLIRRDAPAPEPAWLFQALAWVAVILFVLCTNAVADALGSMMELRFHRASRWILAAVAGTALLALVVRLDPGAAQPWVSSQLLRWAPPGNLIAVSGAAHWPGMIGPFLWLLASTALAISAATRLARRVYLNRLHQAAGATGTGEGTLLLRTWERARAAWLPPALAALAAREALLFVRARRLRFICATAVGITIVYGFNSEGMSPLTLSVLLCFPLVLLTAVFNNAFGFDRGGALAYLPLPIAPDHIFLAKNLVFAAVTVVLTLAGAVPVAFALGTRGSAGLVGFSLLFAYLLVGFLAVGNLISVLLPKAVPPQSLFGWVNPVASLPVALVGAAALVVPPAQVWSTNPHAFTAVMMAALVLAIAAWIGSLFGASMLLRRRPVIL